MSKSQKQKELENKEISDAELQAKIAQRQQRKSQEFMTEFEVLSRKHGLTFGGRAVVTDTGTLAVQIFPTARQTQGD